MPTTPAAATGTCVGMAKALLLLVELAPPAPVCSLISSYPNHYTTTSCRKKATYPRPARAPRRTRRRARRVHKRCANRNLKHAPLEIRRCHHGRRRRRQRAIRVKRRIPQHCHIPRCRDIPRDRQGTAERLPQAADRKLDPMDIGLVLRRHGCEKRGGGFGGQGGLD